MKKFAIAVVLLLMLTPVALAKAYVGASLGTADSSVSGVSGDDTSWKFLGGYTFTKFVGIEGSYRDLGGVDETIGTTSIGMDVSSIDVFGVGILPVGKRFDVFGKAGFAHVEVDATVSDPFFGTVSASDSENELALGAGFNFKFGENFALRAEYETFDTADNMDVISAGAVWRF
jgi:opacity protein-like surface antigen